MLHYLNAVKAIGSKDADAVMAQMRATKVNDVFAKNGELRVDGRMAHGGYVMQAKGPKDSTGPWDIATALAYVPADIAVRPLSAGGCPLVK
jgi:branched-chain amino acid transport system substrate-binding protein